MSRLEIACVANESPLSGKLESVSPAGWLGVLVGWVPDEVSQGSWSLGHSGLGLGHQVES